MKLNFSFLLLCISLILFSCVDHEVVPAPEKVVSLSAVFSGKIDGSTVEFKKDVSGYLGSNPNEINLLTAPAKSSQVLCMEMSSPSAYAGIKIRLGKVYWTGGQPTDLSLDEFNTFCTTPSSILPQYKDDCGNGFNVVYTDGNLTKYTSREDSPNFQNVTFTKIAQESDATGDYSKFECNFDCYVYYNSGPDPVLGKDSLRIQNGVFTGWFKK